MISKLKYMAAAAALAFAPLAASAATITPADSGSTFDLLADAYVFQEQFAVGESGATLTFDFENTSGSTAAVTLFGWTVEQNLAAFTDGVDISFGTYVASADEGVSTGGNTTFIVGAGDTVTLTLTYGNVFDTFGDTHPDDLADIDFTVQAAIVPVPAAGLLLLTALGGIAVMRRRKAAV